MPSPPRILSIRFNDVFMEYLQDLSSYLKVCKEFWLLLSILTLRLFGPLIVLTSGSAVDPFSNTIF